MACREREGGQRKRVTVSEASVDVNGLRLSVDMSGEGRPGLLVRRLLAVKREIAQSISLAESWHLWQYLLSSLPFDVLQKDDALVEEAALPDVV